MGLTTVDDHDDHMTDLDHLIIGSDSHAAASKEVKDEQQVAIEVLLVFGLLIVALAFGVLLKKSGHKYLQEAGLTVIIGALAGLVLKNY